MADQNSIYCPNCKKHTSITPRTSINSSKVSGLTHEISECNSCDFMVLVHRNHGIITKIYPEPLAKPLDENAPEFLKSDLEEAYTCFASGAFRGAGVLARRALQLCCLEKGAPDKKLNEQIDWLLVKQVITKELKEWADEVRLTGNDAAHPPKKIEDDEPVSKDDAEDVLLLLEKFIDVLYIAPALAAERKAKREKPKDNQ